MEEPIIHQYDEHVKSYRRYSFIQWLYSERNERVSALRGQKIRLIDKKPELPEVITHETTEQFVPMIENRKFDNIALSSDIHIVEQQDVTISGLDKNKFENIPVIYKSPNLSDISGFMYKINSQEFNYIIHDYKPQVYNKIDYVPEIETSKFENICFDNFDVPDMFEVSAEKVEKEKFQKLFDSKKICIPPSAEKFTPHIDRSKFTGICESPVNLPEFKNFSYFFDKTEFADIDIPEVQISELPEFSLPDFSILVNIVSFITLPELNFPDISDFSADIDRKIFSGIQSCVVNIPEKPEISALYEVSINESLKNIIPKVSGNIPDISDFSASIDGEIFSGIQPCTVNISEKNEIAVQNLSKEKFTEIIPEIKPKITSVKIPIVKPDLSSLRNIGKISPPQINFSDVFQTLKKERGNYEE